jgi:hypothetical protein
VYCQRLRASWETRIASLKEETREKRRAGPRVEHVSSSLMLVLDVRAIHVQRVNTRPLLSASSTVDLSNHPAPSFRSPSRSSLFSVSRFALSYTTTAHSASTPSLDAPRLSVLPTRMCARLYMIEDDQRR